MAGRVPGGIWEVPKGFLGSLRGPQGPRVSLEVSVGNLEEAWGTLGGSLASLGFLGFPRGPLGFPMGVPRVPLVKF